jgi:hypothetical protein
MKIQTKIKMKMKMKMNLTTSIHSYLMCLVKIKDLFKTHLYLNRTEK